MPLSTLKIILRHPLNRSSPIRSVVNWLTWHISVRLSPLRTIYSITEKAKILVSRNYSSATGCVFCGLFEFEDMSFLLHFLRETDTFIDVGANVGVYSILASAEVGAYSVSVEPIPSTFNVLQENIFLNNISNKVRLENIGLSDSNGMLNFTKNDGATNRVTYTDNKETMEIPVYKLDDIVKVENSPILLKIDVEGYETKVLAGSEQLLQSDNLKAIIIELNGFGATYGFDDRAIHDSLLTLGFRPYKYNPFERSLTLLDGLNLHNTLYVKDLEFVTSRLKVAKNFNIKGQNF